MTDYEIELIKKRRIAIKQKTYKVFIVTVGVAIVVMFVVAVIVTRDLSFAFFLANLVALAVIYIFAFVDEIMEREGFIGLPHRQANFERNSGSKKLKISQPFRYKLLKLSELLFSTSTQKEIFLPAMADWDQEIYDALVKDRDAELFIINARNIYGFILAMWRKSPIGDLIEFVVKIAKG